MSNKQGQQTPAGNKKQEGQVNREAAKAQQQQAGEGRSQQGAGNRPGPQPGSQKDRKGRIGQ